jgi:adenine phosphoribosyltransferase
LPTVAYGQWLVFLLLVLFKIANIAPQHLFLLIMDFSQYIRDVKDFPKQGIVFKDITTLLKDATALHAAGQQLYEFAKDLKINKVVGIESRGFIYGLALADKLGAGFVNIRWNMALMPSKYIKTLSKKATAF